MYRYINLDERVSLDEVSELERFTSEYPWFSHARLLALKVYKDNEADAYCKHLNVCTLFAADRKKLFTFLESAPHVEEIFQLESDKEIERNISLPVEISLPRDELLQYSSEYFSLDDYNTIETQDDQEISPTELIDKFIRDNPRIIPHELENTSRDDIFAGLPPEDMVSETLAEIYLEQSIYDKAIECYEKLILLDPEKSIYFAGLIDNVKNKKTNKIKL
ncbi:MAG: tetratricopeptide repeat protein [Prevotellaceae bacterium]|nr:tetratricopeptide repeat protein [Prevotellaceae bacterium]